MQLDKFMDMLEEKSEKGSEEALTEAMMHGENVPDAIKKKYGFKWAYVPEKYNIVIGLKQDSNDFENDKWEIVAMEPKSKEAVAAKKGMGTEFGESVSEAIDPATFVEVSKSGDMNFLKLLETIKDLLENKTIGVLNTTAAKLKTKK